MEIIDPADEFAPLQGDRLDFLLIICAQLEALAESEWISSDEQECLNLARHHMMVLMAQVMAGFDLFSNVSELAKLLYSDLLEIHESQTLPKIPNSLSAYEAFIADGVSLNENG